MWFFPLYDTCFNWCNLNSGATCCPENTVSVLTEVHMLRHILNLTQWEIVAQLTASKPLLMISKTIKFNTNCIFFFLALLSQFIKRVEDKTSRTIQVSNELQRVEIHLSRSELTFWGQPQAIPSKSGILTWNVYLNRIPMMYLNVLQRNVASKVEIHHQERNLLTIYWPCNTLRQIQFGLF